MLSRHPAPRLLVRAAGSLGSFRSISLLHRTFASSAPAEQAGSSSAGSTQATQDPPRNAVGAHREERDTEKTQRRRVVRAKSHYINPLKPQVSIRTKNGHELTFNLDPTPKANAGKLTEAVKSLCSWPADYSQESKLYTVGQPQWSLTKNGDGVFRLLAVKSPKEGDEITSRIQKAADEMNHHPTIISLKPEGSHTPLHMCVFSTTHQPRGLSMRDIRLAQAADTILQDYDVERPIFDTNHEQAVTILRRANNRIRSRIYEAIQDTVAKATATPDASKNDPRQTDNSAA